MRRGFSIIEVLVSAAIAAVAISASLQGLVSMRQVNASHIARTTAMLLAEDQIEELLVRFRDDADLGTGTWGPLTYDRDGMPTAGTPYFTTTWTVEENVPVDGVRRITVTVRWTKLGKAEEFSLQTERT